VPERENVIISINCFGFVINECKVVEMPRITNNEFGNEAYLEYISLFLIVNIIIEVKVKVKLSLCFK
jgi:hypothetical protein